MTSQTDLEDRLKHSEAELSRIKEEFQDFLYSIAHELSGPLRQASGFSEMILRNNEDKLDEKTEKHLNIILSSALNGRQSLEALRGFSSTLQSGLDIQPNIDLKTCVEAVLEDLRSENLGQNADINIRDLPSLSCDPKSISQLFYQLIKNALIFQPATGTPEIKIEALQNPSENLWTFSVTDNGIGVIAHRIDDIFKPFKRCHSRSEYPGDGLGLTTAKSIVKSHAGNIWIDKTYTEGARVLFTLGDDV